ncbi:uncharacterized protein LOC135691033 isoform X1 [Rhopilema esculentum]|uniref:uncharacterized protein LOC135691033 isoform X1 n=1 Tax=Rhopilema esculentum TaxID=499914 RepID=UPI0031D2089E
MKCKSPAVKFAAVKTAVELAEMAGDQCDTVLTDLISMLDDPAKIVREEAKKGLLSLAGINDFNTLQSVATRVSALKRGPTLKKDDENLNDLREWTDTYSKKTEASGISNRNVTDWLIGSQPKPLKDDLFEEGSCEETIDKECAVSQEKVNEVKSIEEKATDSPNYIELIAPRLAKKFQQLTVDSNSDCSSLEKISEEECDMKEILLRLDDFSTNSNVSFEEEDSPSPTQCTESNVLNETPNNTGPTGIRKVKIVKKVKEVKKGKKLPHHKKQELVSALLEASTYMLLTKRAFKDQNREPNDEIALKKLTLILKNLVIREDSKIVPVADQVLQFLKKFKDKMQSDVLKLTLEGVLPSRKNLDCNGTQKDPTDTIISQPVLHHRHLIPSPISRVLVPGIRGERIANAIEFSHGFPSTQALPREHQILGIPERLGNVAIADSGFCQFGKMKLSWTSRAPCYDMDLKALNEQRIKPLLIPQRTLPDEAEIYDKRVTSNSILPLLFKQRMNTSTQQIRRTIARNSQPRKKMRRNVIRLPRISFEKEKGQRPESVASICSDVMEFNSSKATSNPPPPPNTAELRL